MGRRKLPSIPTQRIEKVSESPPAPIYLTSSAPILPASTERQYFTQDHRAYSRPSSRAASLTDLSRPSSSASGVLSTSDYRNVDPAIIPGATIANVRPKLRQTTTAATGGRLPPILMQPTTSKMPSTLARVLLKKELKEVLERRRETLEACEIEANQRQYVVHRMLITGLLPEYRPADVDDIPNVIPCLLPIELISGARVIPSVTPSTTSSVTATADRPLRPSSAQSQTQEIGVSTDETKPKVPKVKSVGTQAEGSGISPLLHSPATSYHVPSTSLRMQIDHDRYISSASTSALRPRVRSAETQTNGLSAHDQRRAKAISPITSSRRQKLANHVSSSDTNLLESTAKYFAEYDRQLREHGRRMKSRFAFTDDDPVSRESKKLRLMDELAQRKEKISSMTDLSSGTSFPTIHPSSDYSSTVPHYGSLPRIDYPSSTSRSPRSQLRDFTFRDSVRPGYVGYGSLPRNYERYMDLCAYDQPQSEFVQPPQVSTWRYDALSRSLHDLNLSADDNIIDPRMRPVASRSMSFLGAVPFNRYYSPGSNLLQPLRRDNANRSQYAGDAASIPYWQRFDELQSLPNPDMISQYANYLSNQFMSDQQQLMREYPAESSCFSDSAIPVQPLPYSNSRYEAPLSDSQILQQQPDGYFPQPLSTIRPRYSGYQSSDYPAAQLSALPFNSYFDQAQRTAGCIYPTDGLANVSIPSRHFSQIGIGVPSQSDYRCSTFPSTSYPSYAAYEYPSAAVPIPSLSQVYSRNEANYGSRPAQFVSDYGNFQRNRVQATRQMDPFGDMGSKNISAAKMQYSGPYNLPPTTSSVGSYQSRLQQGRFNICDPISLSQIPPAAEPPRGYDWNLPSRHGGKAWSNGNLATSSYDAVYPKEDALSRIYASVGHQRPSRMSQTGERSTYVSSLGRNDRRQRRTQGRGYWGTQSAHASDDSDASGGFERSRRRNASHIKRILLTRKYRDSNVYNDLGIRVTGGKRLPNGELGAFISAVNRGKARETLGEIKEGDQVLEWNGVLLTGKTFEEVERVISASKGEIEIIIASNENQSRPNERQQQAKTNNFYDSVADKQLSKRERRHDEMNGHHKEAPPVPAHRCVDGRASPAFDYHSSSSALLDCSPMKPVCRENRSNIYEQHSLGYLNVAIAYNRLSSTLLVTVLSAKGLSYRQYSSTAFYPNPFVKIYLLPGRKVSNKRRTKFVPNTADPIWNQTVEYIIPMRELYGHYLEFTVWDYDKINDNNSLGQVLISLSEPYVLDGNARWYPLQTIRHNFAVSGLLGSQFQSAIGNTNDSYHSPQYNPASLDIGYPAIN